MIIWQSSLKTFLSSTCCIIMAYAAPDGLTGSESRRSWSHVHSRTYSWRTTAPEDGSAIRLYRAESSWGPPFHRLWRRPPREHRWQGQEATTVLFFRCHQIWVSIPARIVYGKMFPWVKTWLKTRKKPGRRTVETGGKRKKKKKENKWWDTRRENIS